MGKIIDKVRQREFDAALNRSASELEFRRLRSSANREMGEMAARMWPTLETNTALGFSSCYGTQGLLPNQKQSG